MNVFRAESRAVGLNQKSADFIVFVLHLGPDHGDIGDRAGGDPHLFAIEDVFFANFAGAGAHAARIRTEVRLSKAKAAEFLSFLQSRQPSLLLLLAAKRV